MNYHTLIECLGGDTAMAWALTIGRVLVFVAYLMIGLRWRKWRRALPSNVNKGAMDNLVAIFVLCGFCGYMFEVIAVFVPPWTVAVWFYYLLAAVAWVFVIMSRNVEMLARQHVSHDEIWRIVHKSQPSDSHEMLKTSMDELRKKLEDDSHE